MAERLNWERDGRDWPHRETSRFISAAGLRWHVQRMAALQPTASTALLLHGTGASTHSWRGLMPLLAEQMNVLALDLPGHGFSEQPTAADGMSLPGMARAVGGLLRELGVAPTLIVGHSAGAAIALRMCLDGLVAPQAVVSINGALLPLAGIPGRIFSPAAKLLALNPLVPRLFSWRARDPAALKRLIDGTGSRLDPAGIALYGQLVNNVGHVAGALAMMANWDLGPLLRDMPRLAPRLLLIVGSGDRTVPPTQSQRIAALLTGARVTVLPGLGHLAHEEQPQQVAQLVLALAPESGVRAGTAARAAATRA